MTKPRFMLSLAAAFIVAALPASPVHAQKKTPTSEEVRIQLEKDVPETVAAYRKADPGLERFFKDSAGHVVFSRIGKGGFIFAGGHGTGGVYEEGQLIGAASITLASLGFQAGASKGANYRDGVAVFTQPLGGAMVEAALGAQKFSFRPDAKK